ncbi:MAG TPA: MerR family transcriptional regulator [Candidatus Dormibacteraeota bacterium]|jgi:DNA-binding transcriptional MerR regulator|nr:MerR family transcriptional regulator [Candidatus Dormibacteraeota bacterium]
MSHRPEANLTIDDLARETGVTVRNIRAHQSRGLLPPPEVRGRTGYYGAEHVDRLRLVLEMQADGFNLNAVKRILDEMPPGSAGRVLGLERALRAPWGEEEPAILSEADVLAGLDAKSPRDSVFRRAVRLGLIKPLGADAYEVPSPVLSRAAVELSALGIPPERRLDVEEEILRRTSQVAKAFVKLFLDQLWLPFVAAGSPEADEPRIMAALDRLRPLATEALVSTFHLAMSAEVERALRGQRGRPRMMSASPAAGRPSPRRRTPV